MEEQNLIKAITEKKLDGVIVNKPFLKNRLGLPDYFRFGLEIEGYIKDDVLRHDIREYERKSLFNYPGYEGKTEFTVYYEENDYGGIDYSIGGEIVSPILEDSEEAWQDIKLSCEYLQKNAKCTDTCSVHINVGAQSLGNNYQNWYNFFKIFACCEHEIYRYLADGKMIRSIAISGGFRRSFAMPCAMQIREGLARCDEEGVQDINTLWNYCSFNGHRQTRKNKSVSLKELYVTDDKMIDAEKLDIPLYGRRIEFRMANGTFDPVLIQNFVYTIQRILDTARNLTPEQNKKLDDLLTKSIPNNYNDSLDMSRVLDVANLLFDDREDKLQFLYTILGKEKAAVELTDREEILRLIREENMILEFLSPELRADREIVLEAVRHGGAQLEFASDELKNDREIVLTAVRKYARAIEFASKSLQGDKEILQAAIKKDGNILQFLNSDDGRVD